MNYYHKEDVNWNGRGVLTFDTGNNNTLSDNLFENITVHALSLISSKDNIISHNSFIVILRYSILTQITYILVLLSHTNHIVIHHGKK